MKPLILAACVAAVTVTACDRSPTGLESIDLAITLDQATYSLSSDQAAVVTLTNNSPAAVHMAMGVYVYFERLSGGDWVDAAPWFVADGFTLAPSFPLNPGGKIVERFPFSYLRGPGTYRFRFIIGVDPDVKRLVPSSYAVSPAFEVRQ